jgi:hypothetical protein
MHRHTWVVLGRPYAELGGALFQPAARWSKLLPDGWSRVAPQGELSANHRRAITTFAIIPAGIESHVREVDVVKKGLMTVGGVGLVAIAASLAVASPASAAGTPRNEGAACVQAGIQTLKSLGLFQAAAQKKIDYSTLANPVSGPIFADLPPGSFLSLGQVIKLHHQNPQLFAWCR